jgi:hypothetical protein
MAETDSISASTSTVAPKSQIYDLLNHLNAAFARVHRNMELLEQIGIFDTLMMQVLNSNAFINPPYPNPQTLFIHNPPAVFGSGYTQAVAEEMSIDLFVQRDQARVAAKKQPGKPLQQTLTAKGVNFGTFTTTFIANSQAKW